ncbi:MAG: ATP synthase F0 subunit B [Deltaproteobacteria bacterium]|nr:ATP synthase F0 subunit B [Deltaproteobacteria bacterium]
MNKYFNHQNVKKIFIQIILAVMTLLLVSAFVYASGGGEGGHDDKGWAGFAWSTLNFIILIGFLYWLGANKIKEFFSGRRENLRISLDEAIAAKEEAEKKYQELSEKLDKATGEITDIAEMIRTQGEAEKERIIEDAKKAAEKIREDAQRRVEQEFKKASNQLRAEAVALSVEVAEDILKKNITLEDHENIVRDYLDKVVSKH